MFNLNQVVMSKTFRKMYEDALKSKALKSLAPKFVSWSKEDQQIIGVFISRNEVQGELGNKTYYQYLMETDEGRVKFSLGGIADGEFGGTLVAGQVYCITYRGKEKLKGGRQVNRFEAEELGSADDLNASDEPEDSEGDAEGKAAGGKGKGR